MLLGFTRSTAVSAPLIPALGKDWRSLKCPPLPGCSSTSRDYGDFKRHQPHRAAQVAAALAAESPPFFRREETAPSSSLPCQTFPQGSPRPGIFGQASAGASQVAQPVGQAAAPAGGTPSAVAGALGTPVPPLPPQLRPRRKGSVGAFRGRRARQSQYRQIRPLQQESSPGPRPGGRKGYRETGRG